MALQCKLAWHAMHRGGGCFVVMIYNVRLFSAHAQRGRSVDGLD